MSQDFIYLFILGPFYCVSVVILRKKKEEKKDNHRNHFQTINIDFILYRYILMFNV